MPSLQIYAINPRNTDINIRGLGSTATRQRQFSQEVRLASSGQRRLGWLVGGYYVWQTIVSTDATGFGADAANWYRTPTSPLPLAVWSAAPNGYATLNHSDPRTKSYAAFGQATWHITDALRFTVGLRFGHRTSSVSVNEG